MAVHVLKGFDRLSDSLLEANYQRVERAAVEGTSAVFDLRWLKWFDIWALIQLLLVIERAAQGGKRVVIHLVSPRAIPAGGTQVGEDHVTTAHIYSRLNFLSEMGFLRHAECLRACLKSQLYAAAREK